MSKVTLTFEVEEDIAKILAESATAHGEDVAQLLRDLAEDYAREQQEPMDEPDWLIAEIDEGLREANDPNAVWISQEDAQADMQRQREGLLRRIAEQERNR
jgi:hypothetical protein